MEILNTRVFELAFEETETLTRVTFLYEPFKYWSVAWTLFASIYFELYVSSHYLLEIPSLQTVWTVS